MDPDSPAPDDSGVSDARNFLNSVSTHPGRVGDTSFLHPQFAVRLANSIKQAQAAGLNVGMESGFRPQNATGSAYDAGGMSLHDKGAAADINGLGSAGSPQAQQWAQIAAKNGLYNPYGINDPREFNHWQLVPWTLESRPDVQAQMKTSSGDADKIWSSVAPTTIPPGLAFTSPSSGSAPAVAAINGSSRSLAGYKTALEAPPMPADPLDEWIAAKSPAGAAPVDPLDAWVAAKSPAPASTASAPASAAAPAAADPLDEWIAAKSPAPPPAAVSGSPSSFPPGLPPGSYPFGDPRNLVYGQHQNTAPNDTVDPYTPIQQQISTMAKNTAGYVGGQVAGIPSAVSQDYANAGAIANQGHQEVVGAPTVGPSGNAFSIPRSALPSGTLTDPSTWQAGGILDSLRGVVGQASAPLTGTVRQLIQDPVTQGTGNPQAGEIAGLAANALAAPLAGRIAGAGARAVGNATVGSVDTEVAQLASLARNKYGIPVNTVQLAPPTSAFRIGSSALDRLPFSGAGAAQGQQMGAWNNALAGEIGEAGAGKLTPAVANAARERMGNDFDTVAANTTLRVDPQFASDLHDVINRANLNLTAPEAAIVQRQAGNIFNKIDQTDGTISGTQYQALTKKNAPLSDLIDNPNSNLSNAGLALKESLDGMLQRSASPEMQQTLSTARRQWASLMTLKPIIAKSQDGNINPALLVGQVNKQTNNGLAFGFGGNMGELAMIGKRFLQEPGSSNTAERALTYSTMAGLAGDAFRAGSGNMSANEMAMTAAGIPAALIGGRGANALLKSNWLGNQMINRSLNPPVGSRLPNALQLGAVSGAAGALNQPVNALAAPNQ
jgi:hypothetical protein